MKTKIKDIDAEFIHIFYTENAKHIRKALDKFGKKYPEIWSKSKNRAFLAKMVMNYTKTFFH